MNSWHLAAYATTTGGAVTDTDLPAPADGILQLRNNHLIISEPYDMIGAVHIGATVARARFSNPSMITHGISHLWPVNVSATVPSRAAFIDYRDNPIRLPMNEEITIEHTNGAADQVTSLLYLAAPQFSRNIPSGFPRLNVRATVVIAAGAENTWGLPVAITLERALQNGVYAVVGAWVVAANGIAFRLVFPSAPSYSGRQLRPGSLVQNTTTIIPIDQQREGYGEWGRFHTFEPPSIQILSDAAGGTYEVRLDCIYLGQSQSLLIQ